MADLPASTATSRTRFVVHACHPCLPGHFPEQPLVPGVVILEEVQLALLAHWPGAAPTRWPQVKFLTPLLPEQWADIELTTHDALTFSFKVQRDRDVIASGKVQR
ncbi:hydroxymyristoyl-ACP dehydratase [Ahniella affigens]|uniref:Hydroxymyristoyl-ACP dehydratase n=1 Tax=Ahniella affigens TaxID=2021234 RepID=A0A2P1PY89_9GAMM|nr:hydroxymyristoyl-ACP dehydratase [Ahniella affigens]AVP99784.1 hydroxymyristoyl-ACP dehydratase [Ahniella affigens]